MTIDIAKLRAETQALVDGTTPGPWWTDGEYDASEMGCAIIAARTDAGPLPGNPTRGMVAFSSAIINTQAQGCEANARLIAAAPTLAADTLSLLDEIERLRGALERIETASQYWADYNAAPDAVHYAHESTARLARAALAEGDPA